MSLANVDQKFHTPFTIIEGGKGIIRGVMSETEQQSQPSYVFVTPRHVLRTAFPSLLVPGMVIQGVTGSVFLVGYNGPSENRRGVLWQSFRLFEATGQYAWTRRGKTIEPITTLEQDTGVPTNLGMIWAAIEPLDREAIDLAMRISFEQRRVIAGANLLSGDMVDNHPITRVDKELGLSIGIMT